ncbi:MAG: AAA family ATPase [Candidatus Micrarchaeota archaeon]
MITSLRLVNWRSHADTSLKFSAGTNLLVGIMGSGKSAVLDATSFALFGTFPALERRQLKLEDVVRYDENNAKVVLQFSWNSNDYRVERHISKKKDKITTKADIFRDGNLLETGTTAVTELIEETLGLDYDLFTRAIYSEQNNIDYFLSLDPRRRKDEFDRLLGLDRFEKARSAAVALTNKFDSAAKIYAEKYSEGKAETLQKSITEFAEKESKLAAEIKAVEQLLAKLKIEVKELSVAYIDQEKKRKRIEELERSAANLKGQISSLEDGLKKVDATAHDSAKKQLQQLREKAAEQQKRIIELKKKETDLARTAAVCDSKIKEQEERTGKLEKLKTSLQQLLDGKTAAAIKQELAELEKKAAEKASERVAEQKKIGETKEVLKHLADGLKSCPLCESELGADGVKLVKEKKHSEIKKSEERIVALAQEISLVQKAVDELKERTRKIEFANERITTYQQESVDVKQLAEKKKVAAAEIEQLSAAAKTEETGRLALQKETEQLLLQLKSMEDMLKRAVAAEELSKKLAAAVKERAELHFDEKSFEQLRKQLEEKHLEEGRLTSQQQYGLKELKLLSDNKKLFEQQLNEINAIRRKAMATLALVEELKIYKNALLETQIGLRRELIDAINSAMNEIWSIFYPYGNYKTLRVEVTEKDYVFEVLEGEQWKQLESIASGGERACAALTLRVTLAMVLTPNLSWLILDEPTHNLDSQAIELLSDTLQTKVPQVVKQTFVITHEEALIGADFSSTYKLSRDKGKRGPTKVEPF